jgi:GNAT superfamily N-acetyltransferase
MEIHIHPYEYRHRAAVMRLSLRAWAPVFSELEPAVAPYVFRAFYPKGWAVRQSDDIGRFLDDEPEHTLIAENDKGLAGWVGVRLHAEDCMGEIYILAVDPDAQREGVARMLLEAAFAKLRGAGMKIVMVETGDDPGHAPSRVTYESIGFERWPVARYFREL